jgi:hypothetical protein
VWGFEAACYCRVLFTAMAAVSFSGAFSAVDVVQLPAMLDLLWLV